MDREVLITVLMPVYNCEKYIAEAVESILSQTYSKFEFLIVDDGSSDKTSDIIKSYNDPRIKLIYQTNGGVSSALNTGLKHASGKYIARFDGDDICYADRLQDQLDFLQTHSDYIMVGSDANYVSESGDFIFAYENTGHTYEEIVEKIYQKNPFIHSTVMFLKQVIVEAGSYDVNAHTFEDHLLWVKVIKKGKVCNLKKPSIKVRLNPSSVTTDERLRGKRFLELRQMVLNRGDFVTKQEGAEFLSIIRSQGSSSEKKLGYHLFVAKKFLWNNYQPSLARKNILEAIRLKPLMASSFMLLALSFLPKLVIVRLYKFLK